MSNDSKHTQNIKFKQYTIIEYDIQQRDKLKLFIFTYKYCNFENLDLGAVHHSGILSELQLQLNACD